MIRIVERRPPPHRLLKNGEHRFLVALSNGRPVLSLLTGVDRHFVRLTGARQGWFSRFEGRDEPEAARALLAEAAAFLRGLGCERLVGPDAPDGRFLPGLLVEGPGCAPHLGRLLTENGFEIQREYRAFMISGGPAGMARAAARAREKHGVSVRRPRYTRATCRAIHLLYDSPLSFEDFASHLSGMRPFELHIVSVRGEDAGFALLRRSGGLVCVETLMILRRFRRGPALLCLLDALSARHGLPVLTGAIETQNTQSSLLARALGGAPVRMWREYRLDLI